jgi:taurine dioxygenase
MDDLEVVNVATTLGAEIRGIDLARAPGPDAVDSIRRLLAVHKVLFFRGQDLAPDQLTALGRCFGEPTEAHPVEPSVDGHPEVLALDSDEGARADVWHSDLTFQERPPLGALLHAKVVPAVGGDTIWADMAAAHAALSPAMQEFLSALSATHSATKAGDYFSARDAAGEKAARTATAEPVHHPVVRCHPETGRLSLFVNPLFTVKIDGLRRRESDLLLDLVQQVATAPEHVVRWRWQAGDLAFWDNRCTMHYALLDYQDRRRMERVALEGERPVGPAGR